MVDELFENLESQKAEKLLIKYWEEISDYPQFDINILNDCNT